DPHDAGTLDDAVADAAAADRPSVHTRTLVPAVGVSLSAFLLFGAHVRPLGWFVLAAAVGLAWLVDRGLGEDLTLIGLGVSIVSTTSMEADVSWPRFFAIGTALTLAVAVPFLVDRFVYKRRVNR